MHCPPERGGLGRAAPRSARERPARRASWSWLWAYAFGAGKPRAEACVRFVPGVGSHTKLAVYARDGFTPRLRAQADATGVILRTVVDLDRVGQESRLARSATARPAVVSR